MNILAIDSCSSVLSVAVSKDDEIISTQTEAGMKQSEMIMDSIDSTVKKAGLKPGDLNAVMCMGGPGSFTGLRIGFSAAKGLALSLSIPFIPVPTLECIAFPHSTSGLTLAAVEARKNAWFFAVFRGGKSIIPVTDADAWGIAYEITNLKTEINEKITITGHGAASLYEALPNRPDNKVIFSNIKRNYARELIAIAKSMNLLDNYNEALLCSGPEYNRKTDAEISLEKAGLLK